MRLLIVRHAIAVPRGTPGVPDDQRPLTPRGRRRFRSAARGLTRLLPRPSVLLSSPLLRAKQTAAIAAAAWRRTKVTDEPALAGGSFRDVAEALERHSARSLVAVVGHEPHLSAWLARLLAGSHGEPLTFKKGGAALVDLPARVTDGGRLVWFLPPRILRRIS